MGFDFMGIDNSPHNKAAFSLIPVNYDSTTSYKSGTREGPDAIFRASAQVELYDMVTDFCLEKSPFFVYPPLEISLKSPKTVIDSVEKITAKVLKNRQMPIILGGEHSISFGAIKACLAQNPDLAVVQIDAHADLRDNWNGTPYSHACVMRRVLELDIEMSIGIGIRNLSKEEILFMEKKPQHQVIWANNRPVDWPEQITHKLGDRPVYLTIDLDGLDSSIMPSVGTPEPGGLLWHEVEKMARLTEKWNIVGMDMVELCPIPGLHAPDFLAAKLLYLLCISCMRKRGISG